MALPHDGLSPAKGTTESPNEKRSMTDLKEKVSSGLETLEAGVSTTGKKIRAVVHEGRHVLADAGNDAKDAAIIAGARVRIAARGALGDVRRGAKKLTTRSKATPKSSQ